MDERLSVNIKILRLVNGDSQNDLAKAVGTDNSTISKYEAGTRIPDERTIELIAGRYGVKPASLRYDDYSRLPEFSNENIENYIKDTIKDNYKVTYPSFVSVLDCEVHSDLLNSAIKSHRDMITSKYDDLDTWFLDAIKVIDKYRVVEKTGDEHLEIAMINKVSVIMLLMQYFDPLNNPIKDYLTPRVLFGDKKTPDDNSYHDDEDRMINGFFNKYYEDVMLALRRITKSPDYADYGYYYLAYRYVCGFCDTSNTRIDYADVGYFMMSSLALMGNNLAYRFLLYTRKAISPRDNSDTN